MTSALRRFLAACLCLMCFGPSFVFSQVYDCAGPKLDIPFHEVFSQVGEGLAYTEDGEIISAPGRRLSTSTPREVFFHYVARNNPTITVQTLVRCDRCGGKGGFRGIVRKDAFDLGTIVDEKCGACNGRGGAKESMTVQVTYSGQLPPLPASPRRIAFNRKLTSAQDGSAAAQLEVAAGYMEGRVVPKDLNVALDWYTKAAMQGERAALAPLARLYLDSSSSFHDPAYGLALSAVAFPDSVQAEGAEFVRFKDVTNEASSPGAGLSRHLQFLEAGLLAPLIAQGLQDKSLAEKVLLPASARRAFLPKATLSADAPIEVRAAYVRGLARYFGFGFSEANPDEGLRLIESAASRRDVESLLLLGMHFDAGKLYDASAPTAWAFYAVAARAGSTEPFSARRLRQFAETDVVVEWDAAIDVLFERFQSGLIPPAMFRDLADLSLYRTMTSGSAVVVGGPYDTASSQDRPLSKPEVYSRTRSLLTQKLQGVELADEDVTVSRKCWDDGTTRFYSVSGIVTFTNAASRRETAPFTLCFKIKDASTPPTLISFVAGSARFGDFPAECGRRP